MAVVFSNNAKTTLASTVSTSATSITVVDGSVFPALNGADYTYVTLEDTSGNVEIVKVTALSSNVLTVVRAQDNTSARAFTSGDKCELRLTAAGLNEVASQADTDTNTTYSVGDGGLTQINFTSADNTKLDGIETGATADQTAAQILTAIKTVDGSGSGLDADSVDGLHATSFVRAKDRTNFNSTPSVVGNVVGQLGWKNYGNNHTIFDASASTTPSGTSCSDADAAVAWTGTYPTLMGWNGSQTYGVRVDSARNADLLDGQQGSYYAPKTGAGASGTWPISINGNAATSTTSTMSAGRTDSAAYPILWGTTGSTSQLYSATAVKIRSSDGTIWSTHYRGSGDVGGTGEASHHPAGIYSNGYNWLYGTINQNGNTIIGNSGITSSGSISTTSDVRGTVFYDIGNTAYYVDPSANSYLLGAAFGGLSIGEAPVNYDGWNKQLNVNGSGHSRIHAKTTAGRRMGIYAHDSWHNSGGGYVGTYSNHNMTFIQNGSSAGYIDVNKVLHWQGTSVRAPIFYDSNNTGYYSDPASTSSLNTIRLASHIAVGGLSDASPATLSTSGRITFGTLSTDAIDNYSIGTNLENYGGNYNKLDLAFHTGIRLGAHANYGGVRFYTDQGMGTEIFAVGKSGNFVQAANSMRAPIFYDSNNTAYYMDANNTTVVNALVTHGSLTVGQGSSSDIYMYDSDEGTRRIHCNSNRIGFLNSSNGWGSYCEDNGDWRTDTISYAGASVRAPVFYDSNNTGYYCDPSSTSNLNVVTAAGRINANGGIGLDGHTIFNGSDTWVRTSGDNGIYFSSYTGGWNMTDSTWIRSYNNKQVYLSSNLAVAGNVTAYYSDERLKTRTGGIDNALEKVQSLSGFTYVENDLARELGYKNEKQQVGVSAQEVQAVVPEAVSLAAVDIETGEFSGEITSKSGENYLTVDYSRLVPLLIEAVKELKSEVDNLKTQLAQKEQ